MSAANNNPPEPTLEEKYQDLKNEVQLLHKEVLRRNNEILGYLTILCLPITTNKKLEIGFRLLAKSRLQKGDLRDITSRYLSECAKSDITFDSSIAPMIENFGFEKLWKIIDKEKIKEYFGEWSKFRWIEMAKEQRCEE